MRSIALGILINHAFRFSRYKAGLKEAQILNKLKNAFMGLYAHAWPIFAVLPSSSSLPPSLSFNLIHSNASRRLSVKSVNNGDQARRLQPCLAW